MEWPQVWSLELPFLSKGQKRSMANLQRTASGAWRGQEWAICSDHSRGLISSWPQASDSGFRLWWDRKASILGDAYSTRRKSLAVGIMTQDAQVGPLSQVGSPCQALKHCMLRSGSVFILFAKLVMSIAENMDKCRKYRSHLSPSPEHVRIDPANLFTLHF